APSAAHEPCDRLGLREPLEGARERVAGRLSIDVDLTDRLERRRVVEGADADHVNVLRLQPVEQARAAALAEASLGPVRRSVSAEMLLAAEDDAARDRREYRSSGPAPAHAAMADVMLFLERLHAEGHRAAQAAPRGCWHGQSPGSDPSDYRAAAPPNAPKNRAPTTRIGTSRGIRSLRAPRDDDSRRAESRRPKTRRQKPGSRFAIPAAGGRRRERRPANGRRRRNACARRSDAISVGSSDSSRRSARRPGRSGPRSVRRTPARRGPAAAARARTRRRAADGRNTRSRSAIGRAADSSRRAA